MKGEKHRISKNDVYLENGKTALCYVACGTWFGFE